MFKNLFGPSKDEIWSQLAEQVEGKFIDRGWLHDDKVEARHGDWAITLGTKVVTTGKITVIYTELQAPFRNQDNFRFSITRRSIFSGLGKFLGLQDIEIGEPQFDHDFIIKGNKEDKVKELLQVAAIRDLLAAQPEVHFEIKADEYFFSRNYPEGVDILNFRIHGILTDLERLKNLYNLFSETLDQLGRMGIATGFLPEEKEIN